MNEIADVIPMRHTDGRTRGAPGELGRNLGRTVNRTGSAVGDAIGSTIGTAVSSIADAATDGVRSATRRLTEEPAGTVDGWGRDPFLVRNAMFAAQLRWDVSTGGDQRLPKRRGALIVVNSPRWMLTPIFTAFAISEATDRPVRFVGRSDGDPAGSLARRLGGLLDHPDELAGALRADELVVIGARHSPGPRDVGEVDHTLVGAALASGVKVFPAATSSSPFARRARVEIGTETRPPTSRRGPLTELELAQKLRRDIRILLDEMGDISTGTPLDWLPFSGLGAH
jgi:hypothetical protein